MMKRIFIYISLIFLFDHSVSAEIIFSDDFEWGSDWACDDGSSDPVSNGWSGILCSNRGGSLDVLYVNTDQAESGTISMVQYWDSTSE